MNFWAIWSVPILVTIIFSAGDLDRMEAIILSFIPFLGIIIAGIALLCYLETLNDSKGKCWGGHVWKHIFDSEAEKCRSYPLAISRGGYDTYVCECCHKETTQSWSAFD